MGTAFHTDTQGQHVTWIVIDCDGHRQIRHAPVAAGRNAGTVEVRYSR